jgi:hypothetical protein
MNHATKYKKTNREFYRDENSNSDDITTYNTLVRVSKCEHNMDCENCPIDKEDKYACKRKCIHLDSNITIREYGNVVDIDMDLYDDNIDSYLNNLESLDKMIETLKKYKLEYIYGVEILKGNLKNVKK